MHSVVDLNMLAYVDSVWKSLEHWNSTVIQLNASRPNVHVFIIFVVVGTVTLINKTCI